MRLSFAPSVERVVHHHSLLEHPVVIIKVMRQTKGQGIQASRLGRQVQARCVCTSDDDRQLLKCRVSELVLRKKGVKATQLTNVSHLDAWNVSLVRIQLIFGIKANWTQLRKGQCAPR